MNNEFKDINQLALNIFSNLKYYSPNLQYDSTAKTYHLSGCNVKLCLKFNEDNILYYFCTGDFFGISLAELLVRNFNSNYIDDLLLIDIKKLKNLNIRSTNLVNEYWNRFIQNEMQ